MKMRVLVIFLLTFLLSSCGNGGENWANKDPSAIAVSPNSFDVAAAWTKLIQTGYTKSFSLNPTQGTCAGTMRHLQSAAEATNISSQYFYRNTLVIALNFTNCSDGATHGPVFETQDNYYSDSYQNTYYGNSTTAGYWAVPAVFPNAAKVGDTGQIGALNLYSDDGTVWVGYENWSYTIEQDTASTAVLRITMTARDVNGDVLVTEYDRYVIYPDNTLSLRTIDMHYPSGFKVYAY